MTPKSLEDIIHLTAKECQVSDETVKNVHNNLWESIRYYITNPLESRRGIILNEFIKFEIPEERIQNYLDKQRDNLSEEKIKFYERLKEQVK